MGGDDATRPAKELSPTSRRAFLLTVPMALAAGAAATLGGCGGGGGGYADQCYCNGPGSHYNDVCGAYCNYMNGDTGEHGSPPGYADCDQ